VLIYEEKHFADVVKATVDFNENNQDPKAAIITSVCSHSLLALPAHSNVSYSTVDSIEVGGLLFGLGKL